MSGPLQYRGPDTQAIVPPTKGDYMTLIAVQCITQLKLGVVTKVFLLFVV